ncbi:MAG: hypothetical protein GC199_10945 [Alphaproteobacteria bacterium]|nr:hypothetical protein [Alphaproteobacteria bacterium]
MDLFDIPVLNVLRQKMAWLSARQSVIAENVANTNTPGFQAQDLEDLPFEDILEAHERGDARREDSFNRHSAAAATRRTQAMTFERIDAPGTQTSPNGNSVVLEEQMLKISETQLDYAAATGLYRKALNMLRLAAVGNR